MAEEGKGHVTEQKMAKGHKTPRKSRKKLKRTVIEHMDNHGHTVSHEYQRKATGPESFPSHEETKHAFTDDGSMMAHLNSMFGGKGAAPAAEPEEAEAEPDEDDEEA